MPVTPRSLRFGIVASRFNEEITKRLVEGALRFFQERRLPKSRLEAVWVPGAFELPVTALTLARSGRYSAIVAVGCILEGETPHYRYLSEATLQGLMMAGVLTGVPVTSGVITAEDWDLALKRSQNQGLNRGREAAKCAWELAQTLKAKR